MKSFAAAILFAIMPLAAAAQENRIDLVRPDAPELAAIGDLAVGVRTLNLVNRGQKDILKVEAGKPHPVYDRALTIEVWYPAEGSQTGGKYENVLLRDGKKTITLTGRAVRDAAPAKPDQAYPLVVISHGYPGNRFLMSPLAENLASKGYVVASIDHRDSTYDDQKAFGSTLVNRPLDQAFVLAEIGRLAGDEANFLFNLADAQNAALIGYSMGGYGAVISAGGGVTKASTELAWGAPDGTLGVHLAGSDTLAGISGQYRTYVAFAPWGMKTGFWDAEGLKGIEAPVFFIAGDADDVSGYEGGVKAIFEQAVNAERFLLTFENANHNAAAPMPAPAESWLPSPDLDFVPFDHYADPVWDNVRMNNISQHFVTAWLDWRLKSELDKAAYFDLVERARDGKWSKNEDGTQKDDHTYWAGFPNRTAIGLKMEHREAAE